jgi:leucyl/phenylalanyl-tRNA---protein transferase
MPVFQLNDYPFFPPAHLADKSGLLAIGGQLQPDWILMAYENGIFPWFNEDEPIMWWSPDPRMVLFPSKLHVSQTMKQVLNRGVFEIKFDTNFNAVIENCGNTRRNHRDGTWITPEMKAAYTQLHELGVAHSAEAYNNKGELVGGLYGLAIGSCFFGESMFSLESNASKAAFITLVKWLKEKKFTMIDCQVASEHLASLGAQEISRKEFFEWLNNALKDESLKGHWTYQGL